MGRKSIVVQPADKIKIFKDDEVFIVEVYFSNASGEKFATHFKLNEPQLDAFMKDAIWEKNRERT